MTSRRKGHEFLRNISQSWANALIGTALLTHALAAEPIAVRHSEGTVHGFLTLRTLEGKTLAAGDLIQIAHGDRVVSRLVFRFKDGSLDDETAIFSQRGSFHLISDHHVQKGPAFPHPMDLSINASTGQVTVRFMEKGNEKVGTHHLELPPDLANGVIPALMKNLRTDAKETKLSFLAATPKPRLVHLAISPQGEETFSVAGFRHKAIQYVVKVEIGGIAGVVAPIVGKQPQDIHVWMVTGQAPEFVKSQGPLYEGGPILRTELANPVWQSQRSPGVP